MKKKLNWYLNETLHRCTDVQLLLAHCVVVVILDFRHGNNLFCDYMDERFKRESILIASTHISNDRNMAICSLVPRVFASLFLTAHTGLMKGPLVKGNYSQTK